MWNVLFSETPLTECRVDQGHYFWTAGQRIDPTSLSEYVWRVTSTDSYNDTVHAMTYANWEYDVTHSGPYYTKYEEDGFACVLFTMGDYQWSAYECSEALCSVCELD